MNWTVISCNCFWSSSAFCVKDFSAVESECICVKTFKRYLLCGCNGRTLASERAADADVENYSNVCTSVIKNKWKLESAAESYKKLKQKKPQTHTHTP